LLPVLALSLGVPGVVLAARDTDAYRLKPGATGTVCLSCHVDFEETVSQPFVHTPVKAGDCSDCHDPHASDHGMLLAADSNSICVTCHADLVPESPTSFHSDVVDGQCVSCHDPHASNFKNNLRAQGNDLCLGCHEDLASAMASAEHKHRPVEGDCLGCHTPHASTTTASLLATSVPALCVACHDTTRASFVKDHRNYPVAESNCSSCHDPHGSPNRGILWAGSHSPVSRGMCSQCHVEPDGTSPPGTKAAGAQLCRGCHNEMYNDTFVSKNQIHWPLVDQAACANCHTPHGSKNPALLAATEGALCGSCHQDAVRRQQSSVTKHDPIVEGDCGTCHDPHASNQAFLLAGGQNDVCGTCHDWRQHSAHPMGEKVVDQRNQNLSVDCLSCHRTHGTANEKLAFFEPRQDLCVQCHSSVMR
jgi:predicted CXXCH cytochrome family protein